MALYDDLKKKQEELQRAQIEVEKQLKEIKEQRKEEAIRQNLEEDKKVLLKYVHHPSWCYKKENKGFSGYIHPDNNCPACVLEEIFNMEWGGRYAFSIDAQIHEVDEYDYKENEKE